MLRWQLSTGLHWAPGLGLGSRNPPGNSSNYGNYETYCPGWWFGTFFIFPNSWDDDPIWLIFFRGVETTNQLSVNGIRMGPIYPLKKPSISIFSFLFEESFWKKHDVVIFCGISSWKKQQTVVSTDVSCPKSDQARLTILTSTGLVIDVLLKIGWLTNRGVILPPN